MSAMATDVVDYVLGNWDAYPDGSGVAEEYRLAVGSIAVLPELMHASDTRTKLMQLCINSEAKPTASFEDLLILAIKKAAGVATDRAARSASGSLPGILDTPCRWFDDVKLYYDSVSWEQQYLTFALSRLVATEDPSGLLIVLAMLARAARECAARKRATFSTIINRVTAATDPSTLLYGSESALCTTPKKYHAALESAPDDVKAAAARIHDLCASLINDMKDSAFESTFMQPTLMYAALAHDEAVAVDAEVHGAPTYLALLEATTGIRTSRLLELDDDAKGIADFLNAGMTDAIKSLWAVENIGRSWCGIRECARARPTVSSSASNVFIFQNRYGWSFKSIRDMVQDAISPAVDNIPKRAAFSRYLQQYCSYFTAEVIMPRLFTAALNGRIGDAMAGCGITDDPGAELEKVFSFLKMRDMMAGEPILDARGDGVLSGVPRSAAIPPECDGARSFVWDLDVDPPRFNVEAARRLFAATGLVKCHGWAPDSVPRPLHKLPTPLRGLTTASRGKILQKSSIRLTAAGDVRGGGTGREILQNLLNDGTEPWNKWLHPGYVSESWVQADFIEGPQVLTAYGLCSANDSPHRDPTAWRLMGRTSLRDQWRVLHEFPPAGRSHLRGSSAVAGFTSRWQWLWFDLADTAPQSSVKLEIRNVRAPGDCLQLGHFHLRVAEEGSP